MQGRRVLVAGAGVSGRSAAAALAGLGAEVVVTDADAARVAGSDLAGVRGVVGLEAPPEGTDLVVTSPGWRPTAPLLVAAARAGIEVIGEVELAWRLDRERPRPATWLAVTGTNGKTTTIGMVESMLLAAGLDAVACGNVGLPVVDAVLAGHAVLAVELSSFQLHWSPSVRPHAGAVLNVAEDHLDWHASLEEYVRAKARVLTGAVAVAGLDDACAARLLAAAPAPRKVGFTLGGPGSDRFGVRGRDLVDGTVIDGTAGAGGGGLVLASVDDVRPGGPTGLSNALAAAALARTVDVPADAIATGLRAFRPAGHRGVVVAEHAGVQYVDDSKATNPHAAGATLSGFDRVVWIAGGLLKGAGVDELVRSAAPRLAGVVLIGRDRAEIAAALARHAPDVPVTEVSAVDDGAMVEAVRAAAAMTRPGDTVLLAPAAASWDMFASYGHRGDVFAAAAAALAGRATATALKATGAGAEVGTG